MEEFRTKIVTVLLGIAIGLVCEEIGPLVPSSLQIFYWLVIIGFFVLLASLFFNLDDKVLFKYRDWNRYRIPFKVAVFNGYAKSRKEPHICKSSYCDIKKDRWTEYFEDCKNFDSTEIYADKICDNRTVAINPYGEVHQDTDRMNFMVLEKIKKYIARGGIFVCTGGIPFYYVWEPLMGRTIDTTPVSITIVTGGGIVRNRLFTDSLVTREFGALVSGIPTKPIQMTVSQDKKDQEIFGDLLNVGGTNKVFVFRPISEKSPRTIPALRVRIEDEEFYPLVAVSYGDGYLVISGMHVTSDVEFLKITKAIENFVSYLQNTKRRKII